MTVIISRCHKITSFARLIDNEIQEGVGPRNVAIIRDMSYYLNMIAKTKLIVLTEIMTAFGITATIASNILKE
ncbi:MAG: hypothetical protein WAJ93_24925 [Candidatus Nitrosopolaris sp.]